MFHFANPANYTLTCPPYIFYLGLIMNSLNEAIGLARLGGTMSDMMDAQSSLPIANGSVTGDAKGGAKGGSSAVGSDARGGGGGGTSSVMKLKSSSSDSDGEEGGAKGGGKEKKRISFPGTPKTLDATNVATAARPMLTASMQKMRRAVEEAVQGGSELSDEQMCVRVAFALRSRCVRVCTLSELSGLLSARSPTPASSPHARSPPLSPSVPIPLPLYFTKPLLIIYFFFHVPSQFTMCHLQFILQFTTIYYPRQARAVLPDAADWQCARELCWWQRKRGIAAQRGGVSGVSVGGGVGGGRRR